MVLFRPLLSVYQGFFRVGHASYHTTNKCLAYDKQLLSKLRKKTGYAISKCRDALESFDNDFKAAEDWLRDQAQKEGWNKASKLQTRYMSSGCIGAMKRGRHVVLMEVNCETDFVARNESFQSLVLDAVEACHTKMLDQEAMMVELSGDELGALTVDDVTLADRMALVIGKVGENMALRRASLIKAPKGSGIRTQSYVHASGIRSVIKNKTLNLGLYGSAVLFKHPLTLQNPPCLSTGDLGLQLAQHVVGMNPRELGTKEDVEKAFNEKTQEDIKGETAAEETEDVPDDDVNEDRDQVGQYSSRKDVDESRMLLQKFLMDDDLLVHELMTENDAELVGFVRYQCGEDLGEDDVPVAEEKVENKAAV